MAASSSSSSQHRCVFVGNIPYDATEEQLIDICREVGPVVSFRLVIDRETGKPKGYGFCEYKDEETALSARRNLQGYEINGRQLRVDFAENDKNADRNREQGCGGPGMIANVDPHKQVGGLAVTGESSQHQPIGLHIAITAATVMAGALGGAQSGMQANQNGLQSHSALASDPLTLHLAKMSRSQLNEIMSELKLMATQNREAARQLLLARPQLPKAIFQAQIMLGMVTPQVLQMPTIRQPMGQPVLPSLQDTQPGHQLSVQSVPGLPSIAQRPHSGLAPKLLDGQVSAKLQPSLAQSQFSVPLQPPVQPQIQIPQQAKSHVPQQATLFGQSGVPPLHPAHPSVRPKILGANPPSLNQHMQPSFLQHQAKAGVTNTRHSSQMDIPNTTKQTSLLVPPSTSDTSFQLTPDVESALLQQLLNLTPEQLSSLPPEQQQEVIQLQQALRRDQLQPS